MNKLSFLFLVALLLIGCTKKSPTNFQSKAVFGEIYGSSFSAEIIADTPPDPATATGRVHFSNVHIDLLQKETHPGKIKIFDYYTYLIPAGTPCSLIVACNLGSSRGCVPIPETSAYYRPSRDDTLPWGDVWFYWASSESATWYELEAYYDAYDGQRRYLGDMDTQFVAYDTFAVVPDAFLRKYPTAAYLWASCYLYTHSGPKPGWPTGNMIGEIRGYLIGTMFSDWVGFYVGTPPPGLRSVYSQKVPRITETRRRAFLSQMYSLAVLD